MATSPLSFQGAGVTLPEAVSEPPFPYAAATLKGIGPKGGPASFSRENAIFSRVKFGRSASISSVKKTFIPDPEMRPIR